MATITMEWAWTAAFERQQPPASMWQGQGAGRTRNVADCNFQLIKIASNSSRFLSREIIKNAIESMASRGTPETDMSDTTKIETPAKPDLNSHYRPLGLKAVAAAAMMLTPKPKTAKTA